MRGEFSQAVPAFEESARLARDSSAHDVLIDAEILKGVVLLRSGRTTEADTTLAAAAAAAKSRGDRFREATALQNRGCRYSSATVMTPRCRSSKPCCP